MTEKQAIWHECGTLFTVFARIGLVLIGGGYVMLPLLQREVVDRRKWLTEKELLNYFAIGQSTPGVIAVNTATFIGAKRAGILGATAATLGVIFPAIIIICCIAGVYGSFSHYPWIETALGGVRVAVAMLLLFTISGLIRKNCRTVVDALLTFAAFIALVVFDISPIPIILLAGLFGIIFYRKNRVPS